MATPTYVASVQLKLNQSKWGPISLDAARFDDGDLEEQEQHDAEQDLAEAGYCGGEA